jgi:hypothetical protein
MKYCTQCSSEYQDGVSACADCGGTELVAAAEMTKRGLPLPHDTDTRKFVRAATCDDPLSSEALVTVLEASDIAVFSRPRRDDATAMPWWEILVPEDKLEAAKKLIAAEQSEIAAGAEEASRAAEEEEKESEGAA